MKNSTCRTDPTSCNSVTIVKKQPMPFGMNAITLPPPEPKGPPPTATSSAQVRQVRVEETPEIVPRPPRGEPKGLKPNWKNAMVFREDVRSKYPELEHYGMPKHVEEQFSKTMCWLLRRGLAEKKVPSHIVQGTAGWYEVETLRQEVENNRRTGFSIKDLLYVVASSAGKRFILFNQGEDISLGHSETKVFIKTSTGQHVVLLPNGLVEDADCLFSESDEMVPDKHLPTGFAYHGTYLSLYRRIIDVGLKPGGDGRTERLMNHLSPYPPGDDRQIAGMREKSECYIIYDLAAFQKDLKDKGIATKVYAASNGTLNTKATLMGLMHSR